MVFSSALFLFIFLPVLLFVYFLSDKKYKNIVLLIGGIAFYAWGAPRFVFVVLATTLLDFFLAAQIYKHRDSRKSKILLVVSIVINVGLLFYFKYFGFFANNINALFGNSTAATAIEIALPLGISFYIFESITYVVDVYRGVHKPLDNFWDYQLYIILFPKLIAGPIVRYHEIADQITDRPKNDTVDNKLAGFYRFCIGLAKKALIADAMATIAVKVYGNHGAGGLPEFSPDQISMSSAWLAALAFTFQIYFDFSGYSDMALGLGRMLGFKFPENFDNPYTSQSITEFWRRWHITLGSWMKNYLYIPLGGNRSRSKFRVYFNLLFVFLISGLWHGANWNFLLWGLWHGAFLIMDRLFLERATQRIGKAPRILLTFFVVVIGWVLFKVENLPAAFGYIKAMFGCGHGSNLLSIDNEFLMWLLLAVFFSFFCVTKYTQRISEKIFAADFKLSGHFIFALLSALFLFFSVSYITSGDFHPFIYYRF